MIKMKILDQVEKSLNDTLESLKCTLKLLNESKEDKVLEDNSKYDKEMTEEEKKIYEEAYVKVGDYVTNSSIRIHTSGDWVRMWMEPYQRRQIIDVFYPLVDYLLKDECAERPQFNQYNRYKIYDNLRDITNAILNRPLKEDSGTQRILAETLIKIYPKNREVFWETIEKVKSIFSTNMKEQASLKKFIQDKKVILDKILDCFKNKYKDDLKEISNYYYQQRDSKLYSTLYGITCRFNEMDIHSSEKDKLITILENTEILLKLDKNDKHKKIFQRLYDDVENMLLQ
jgi:hypothetical protein